MAMKEAKMYDAKEMMNNTRACGRRLNVAKICAAVIEMAEIALQKATAPKPKIIAATASISKSPTESRTGC